MTVSSQGGTHLSGTLIKNHRLLPSHVVTVTAALRT